MPKSLVHKTHSSFALHCIGKGEPLTLIHGGQGSYRHWLNNIDALAIAFTVTALDLPGFGNAADVPADINATDYIDLIVSGFDAIYKNSGPTHLVGFSFGAVVSAHIAARLPQHITRLTLIGPGGFGKPEDRQFDLRKPENSDEESEVIRHNLLQTMLAYPGTVTESTIELQRINMTLTRFDSRKVGLQETLLNNLKGIRCPLQILWGELDAIAYPSVAHRMELCRQVNNNFTLSLISKAGHWAQYENPTAVNSAIINFHGRLNT